jgi:hypothetical protein
MHAEMQYFLTGLKGNVAKIVNSAENISASLD